MGVDEDNGLDEVQNMNMDEEYDINGMELDDLSSEGRPTTDTPDPLGSHERDEDWLLLEESNIFKRLFYRLWYGPREPCDEPPSFSSKFNFLKQIDEFPELGFRKRFPRKRIRTLILVIYCSIWFGILYSILYSYLFRKPFFVPKDGSAKIPILTYDCNSYINWQGKNNACGLNAEGCLPFDNQDYFIRCPALCDRGGWTYSAINVGDQRVKYRGYEIGGGELHEKGNNDISYPYRGDSFVCGSAVHADIVSPVFGGCTRLSMRGSQNKFPSQDSKHSTKFSVMFNSFFPSSYVFTNYLDGVASGCTDPRAIVVTINILFGLPVFYLYESIIGYWIATIVGYWTLVLALDPPVLVDPHFPETGSQLLSIGFQRLLPLCFVLYVEWKGAVKRTLESGSSLCKLLLWYPLLWLGVMNNITFDRLPVDRLTPKDLKEQPGGAVAVGSIAATILTCAIIQAYSLWKSGRFRKFFKIYISFIFGLILLSSIPGLNLRIHHYILGAILVPGCATRGASAYLFQGILIGLILSGVSKWDFASIVETDYSLLRGEAGLAAPPPAFVFDKSTPHYLSWQVSTSTTDDNGVEYLVDDYDGYSLLLNDFEVYVGSNTTIDVDKLIDENEPLTQMVQDALKDSTNGTIPMYFRVAKASIDSATDDHGDYTNAGVLQWPEGIWSAPEPGVS
ncbi:hypothetical protein MOUN0_K05688 [Monosporozyma unispora]|nr:hypothetical protein C6P44_004449 [Kazachstania unispora]